MEKRTALQQAWDAAPELAKRWGEREDAAKAELAALRKDAQRYRWLRDLFAMEDIHEALRNRTGTDEAESLKCDAAVDECMAADRRAAGAA